jgi:spore coat protein U-like protein
MRRPGASDIVRGVVATRITPALARRASATRRSSWPGSVGVVVAVVLVTTRAGAAPACQIANVTPMIFGTYHGGQTSPLDSNGEIDVSCTGPTSIQIVLGRGLSAHESPREMTGPRGLSLAYNLFMDAARTVAWGDGSEGTQTFMGTVMAGQTLRLPVFGRVFALQALPPGNYLDQIVVSIIF